jgi:Fe-Mn family superoxide dismutase
MKPSYETSKFYILPQLPYGYKDLEPYMSEEQLRIHHSKHHQAYVNGANAIFQKIDKSRKENTDIDIKSTLKELSFNIGGHLLHSLFGKTSPPQVKVEENRVES